MQSSKIIPLINITLLYPLKYKINSILSNTYKKIKKLDAIKDIKLDDCVGRLLHKMQKPLFMWTGI